MHYKLEYRIAKCVSETMAENTVEKNTDDFWKKKFKPFISKVLVFKCHSSFQCFVLPYCVVLYAWTFIAKLVYTNCVRLSFHCLTLTLPGPSAGVSGSLDSYCSLKPLCSGMGEVVPARTSPTLLPPSPRTVLSLSCFKVSQCINCRDWHCKS